MSRAMTYYHVVSSTMSPGTPTAESVEKARASWLCRGCGLPRPGSGAVDVQLDGPAENVPLNIVFGAGVGMIRRDLLGALGEDAVAGGLYIGAVFGPDGKRLHEYATFRGRRMVLVRGNPASSYRRCDTCGRDVYFPMGKRYLVGPLAPPFDVAESQFNQLVVSERIRDRLGARRWPKLTMQKLLVQDRASDGLDLPGEVEN